MTVSPSLAEVIALSELAQSACWTHSKADNCARTIHDSFGHPVAVMLGGMDEENAELICRSRNFLAETSAASLRDEEWLPIESAPHGDVGPDEEYVHILTINQRGGMEVVDARRVENAKRCAEADGEDCWFTHWRPTPEPPATQPAAQERQA